MIVNNFDIFGNVTLNCAIGGLNPVAVETGLKMGAKVSMLSKMKYLLSLLYEEEYS
ncbi:DUF6282 family protein [Clostridium sp. AWRP]|uniref:DUF6282 family protein n=1 Tax=Clostridium sp. AWRP TaxID=2212991 RepID=UPI001585EE0D|nr:DUF6282 family protein [Clostridium sp. AWRP]